MLWVKVLAAELADLRTYMVNAENYSCKFSCDFHT